MTQFAGRRAVALGLSLVFAGVSAAHLWKAARRKYADHFDAGVDAMTLIHPVSIIGLGARGLVFSVVALLFFYRFLSAGDAAGTPGTKEALDFIHGLPGGWALLTATGAGLIAFSAYSFIEARWRRINVQDA